MIKVRLKNFKKELIRITSEALELGNANIGIKVRSLTVNLASATPKKTGYAASKWVQVRNKSLTKPYTVSNSAPYIQRLNEGSSKQAPANFIETIALRYGKPVGAVVHVIKRPGSS